MISNAIAQTLTPVTNVGGFDWWPLLIFGVVALVIAGLVVWHRRNPTGEAAALAKAHSELAAAAAALSSVAHKLLAKLDQPSPIAPGEPLAPPAPQSPTPEQLAAVAAAKEGYNQSRAAAGLPPIE